MDMTLYSLIIKKLEGQDECLTWNGLRIEIVDVLPENQLPNVIYLVKTDFIATTTLEEDEEAVVE